MLTEQQRAQLDWAKTDGLLPVVVQHAVSGEVLMLGYMNQEALRETEQSGKVTFFSRTKGVCGPKAKPPAIFSMW